MTAVTFPTALALVLKHEGGFVHHPKDPGGATNKGVTQAVYDADRIARHLSKRSVREITDAEVASIYERQYWIACAADRLPRGVDYCTFDAAVNSGVRRGVKWLHGALGISVDGKPGPSTIANAEAGDPIVIIKRMCAKRMSFLRALATFKVFGKGWTARVVGTAGVEAKSIAMAATNPNPKATAAFEARKASKAAATQKAAAAAASGAGAGGSATQVDPSSLDAVSSLALVGVTAALVVLVIVLIARSRINTARAEAHAAIADGVLS